MISLFIALIAKNYFCFVFFSGTSISQNFIKNYAYFKIKHLTIQMLRIVRCLTAVVGISVVLGTIITKMQNQLFTKKTENTVILQSRLTVQMF